MARPRLLALLLLLQATGSLALRTFGQQYQEEDEARPSPVAPSGLQAAQAAQSHLMERAASTAGEKKAADGARAPGKAVPKRPAPAALQKARARAHADNIAKALADKQAAERHRQQSLRNLEQSKAKRIADFKKRKAHSKEKKKQLEKDAREREEARKKAAREASHETTWDEWRKQYDNGKPTTEDEIQKRYILQKGTKDDPFEKAVHYDDWVSGTEERLMDLNRPVCITHLGGEHAGCDLISQKLCYHTSKHLPGLGGNVAQCFRQKDSCAVVGSSHHLLNASFGSVIDAQDVVIRINAAPDGSELVDERLFVNYKSHVGSRTDVRFVNEFGHVPENFLEQAPMCLFLHEPALPDNCGKFCWRNPGLCNVTCNQGTVRFCGDKCEKRTIGCRGKQMSKDRNWGKHQVILDNVFSGITDQVVPHPTAGFKAVMYALSSCKKVSLFGFGPSCSGAKGARYYGGDVAPQSWHHYSEELMLLEKAMTKGTKAVIPPQARAWMKAESVRVIMPKCLDKKGAFSLQEHQEDPKEEIASLFEYLGMSRSLDVQFMQHEEKGPGLEASNGFVVNLNYVPSQSAGFANF